MLILHSLTRWIQGLSSTCSVFKYFQGLEFRRKKFKYFQGCVRTLHLTQRDVLFVTFCDAGAVLTGLLKHFAEYLCSDHIKHHSWIWTTKLLINMDWKTTGLIPRTLGPFNVFILLNGWICLHGVSCVILSRLLVGFQTHFNSMHFHSFIHSFMTTRTEVDWRLPDVIWQTSKKQWPRTRTKTTGEDLWLVSTVLADHRN